MAAADGSVQPIRELNALVEQVLGTAMSADDRETYSEILARIEDSLASRHTVTC